jgi:hypothetical protein
VWSPIQDKPSTIGRRGRRGRRGDYEIKVHLFDIFAVIPCG